MARPKVKDLAFTEVPDRSAAKVLAEFPVLAEDDCVRFRHVVRLIVHFRVSQRELFRDVPGDGMIRQQRRHLAGLAIVAVAGEAAVRASHLDDCGSVRRFFNGDNFRAELRVALRSSPDELAEKLDTGFLAIRFRQSVNRVELCPFVHRHDKWRRPVSRVQRDQRQLAALNPLDDRHGFVRRDVPVPNVAPPDEDVAVAERFRVEAFVFRRKRDRGDIETGLLLQVSGNVVAEEFRIRLLLRRLLLIPDHNANRVGEDACLRNHGEAGQQECSPKKMSHG